MRTNTFEIGTDPDGRQFIYQAIDELDKNHRQNDSDPANQGRIYEQPGLFFTTQIKIKRTHSTQ